MKSFLTFLLYFGLLKSGISQFQYNFSSSNYTGDTLIIGFYYGDKTLVKDTLIKSQKGNYTWQGNDAVSPGIYIGLLKPSNNIFQFIVNKESKFEIAFDTTKLAKIEVKGSIENKIFLDYISFISGQREKVDPLNEIIKGLEKDPSQSNKADVAKKEIESINNEVKNEQKRIVENYPNSVTAFLIKATNDDISFPSELENDESEDGKLKKYLYYKSKFFDGINFKSPMLVNNNFFLNKMNTYFDKLVSPMADSIKKELDFLLPQMAGNEDALKFFLPHWISKYGNAKIIGHDAVYVHLIDNYFKKGWAPWSDPERMKTLYKYADDWRPTLIGKSFPKIATYKKDFKENGSVDSTLVNLWDVKAPYTLAIFWAADCGHCSKVMPSVVAWEEKYRSMGVKVFSICSNAYDKENTCWPAVKEKKMQNFINTSDHYQNYRRLVSITSTPQAFILDENKKILIKGFDLLKIEEIFEEILKSNGQKL
jgi:thiol-disulfide isomerase/thioredoxin